jgi:hypothetical protein
MVAAAVKQRLRAQYRTLDPVALLAEIRSAQEELRNRIDRRAEGVLGEAVAARNDVVVRSLTTAPTAFARRLGMISPVASRVRRTGGPSDATRNGSGCRQSSTRT